MKKIFCFAIASVLFSAGAFAQQSTSPAKGLYIGAGFTNSWYGVSGTDYLEASSIDNAWYYGPFVEVGYDMDFSKHSGLSVSLRYDFLHSYKGVGTIDPWGNPKFAEGQTCKHYFDIPLRYKFKCPISYHNFFFFDLGPTFNFMLANTTYVRAGGIYYGAGDKIVWSEELPEKYNPFNLSLGATVGFFVGQAKIFLGYDYGGLISFTKEGYGKGQIHSLRFGAAYEF